MSIRAKEEMNVYSECWSALVLLWNREQGILTELNPRMTIRKK